MKTRYVILAVAAAFGLGLTGGQVFSQDMGEGGPPDQQEMMRKGMEYSTPGEQHKNLAQHVGEWDAEVSTYFGPEPSKSKGKLVCKTILGGRYVQEEFTGNLNMGGMQMPFSGQSLAGFDNHTGEFTSIWIDSMGTGMQIMKGKPGEDPKVLIMMGEKTENPVMGGMFTPKGVTTVIDDDTFTYEQYSIDDKGAEQKELHIKYTRRKKEEKPAEEGGK